MKPEADVNMRQERETASACAFGVAPSAKLGIREILEAARTGVARTVNTTQVVANWLIGREILEEEQSGKKKAGYGDNLLEDLASNWPLILAPVTPAPTCAGSGNSTLNTGTCRERFVTQCVTNPTPPGAQADLQFITQCVANLPRPWVLSEISAVRQKSWQPGQLHPNLSWTHYRTLLRVEKPLARRFLRNQAISETTGRPVN